MLKIVTRCKIALMSVGENRVAVSLMAYRFGVDKLVHLSMKAVVNFVAIDL